MVFFCLPDGRTVGESFKNVVYLLGVKIAMSGYPLGEKEIQSALDQLYDWTVKDNQLYKKYQFSSFAEAMGWMVSVAVFTEKIGHHPIWLNIYDSVEVHLTTYDLGHVISNLDVELAQKMEELFKIYHS